MDDVNADKLFEALEIEFEDIMDDVEFENIGNIEDRVDVLEMWMRNSSRILETKCLHYFSANETLQSHVMDCEKMNDSAIRLPSEDDRWLEFDNYEIAD
ncbi:hypothetical protein G5I_01498 [Acromyrmex echinatior]|uniref:Uncharacterized protein n=1 Tax=Acromyrmex echinatior TaxID=103372 RepID=F4W7S5_ACREC|nr:hypothetical protein G5I_01498 [Acromyrmex echinatior]